MQNAIGFISEHTAEYYLVPAIVHSMLAHNVQALPFYFWSYREGSRVGIESGLDRNVRIAAIYPRRPKIRYAGDDHVVIKFNQSLFKAAEEGTSLGIPVLAGAPIASSLFDLSEASSRMWFSMNHTHCPHEEDVLCKVNLANGQHEISCEESITTISEEELFDHIQARSQVMSWIDCVDILREFKRRLPGGSFFGAGYRPFYIALLES